MGAEEAGKEGAGMTGTGLQGGQRVKIEFTDRHPIIGVLSYSISRDTNNITVNWSERVCNGFIEHSTVISRMLITKIEAMRE